MHHLEDVEEVGAHDIHLVDVYHSGHVVFVGLAPDSLGLRFYAALRAKNGNCAVQHAEAALHLNGEVHMARGVDDVDAAILPKTGGGSGSDRDAPLLLLLHPVHDGRALVGLAQAVGAAGIEQDALGGSGFAGVDVRHNADVSRMLKRVLSRHGTAPFF